MTQKSWVPTKLRRANRLAYVAFLVGFPICGLVFGYLFFLVFDFVLGPLQPIAKNLSVAIWGLAALAAGVYGSWGYRRSGLEIQKAIDDSQPAGLVEVLLDKHAPFGDRHDAAMDLAGYGEEAAISALTTIKNDPTEDALLSEDAAHSLLQIQARVESG